MLNLIMSTIWLFLPAFIANMAPAFGANFLKKKTPIDLANLGAGKTIEGFILGVFAGTLVGFLQGNLILGLLLGFGSMSGDVIGSLIKRKLKIPRGNPAPGLDQLDFVIFALLFTLTQFTVIQVIILLIVAPIFHLKMNIVAYLLRMKKQWY